MTTAARFGATVGICAAAASASPSSAAADEAPPDTPTAETLFQEGKRLMAAGDYAAACPMLAESNRLDPAGGTVLSLALCHEAEGKTASAWADFNEAMAMAMAAGRSDRETIARRKIADLEPKLSKLTIVVGSALAAVPGVVVHRDAAEVPSSAWNVAVPVDPGEHQLDASAPGRAAWKVAVRVGTDADAVVVEVGELAPLAEPPSRSPTALRPAPPVPTDAAAPTNHRTLVVVAAVAGATSLVALGIGAFFGIRAVAKSGEVHDRCPDPVCNDDEAYRLNDDAKTSASVATVLIPVGAVTAVAAGVLWYASRDTKRARPTSAPKKARVPPLGVRIVSNGAVGQLSGSF